MYLVSCSPDQKITFQLKKPGVEREKHTREVKMFCPTSLSPHSASTTHCCSDSCLLPHYCHSLLFSPSVPGKKNKIFRPALLLKANSFGEKLICQILICFYWISAERDLQLMPKSNSTFFPSQQGQKYILNSEQMKISCLKYYGDLRKSHTKALT